jgi:hypothetical protein
MVFVLHLAFNYEYVVFCDSFTRRYCTTLSPARPEHETLDHLSADSQQK